MHNVDFHMTDGLLTITVDVRPETIGNAPFSSTGKTRLVASTSGAKRIDNLGDCPVSFSLNVMAKN
jgi:hypothetical protein